MTTPSQKTSSPAPAAPDGLANTAVCRVTYRMTDQMGVVYYANYLEFMEIGRTELMRAMGLSYRQMEEDGFMLPVVRVECDYKSPAHYDDLVLIQTRVARLTRVRIDFNYEITRESDGALLVKGASYHAIIDPAGRPKRLSPEWMARLGGKE